MKIYSIQAKFLITIISSIILIAICIGGISIYEIDNFIQLQSKNFITTTCEKEAAQMNAIFSDMEKSVKIMESYALDVMEGVADIKDSNNQEKIIQNVDKMFKEVVKNTDGAIAYYFRFDPEIANSKSGIFYTKINGGEDYIYFEPTDIYLYDKDDTEHVGWFWQPYEAGKSIWMQPYHNKNNDILMISYVSPLYYANQFVGVVGIDFDYAVLTDKVHEIKIYEHGFAHLEMNEVMICYSDDHSYTTDTSRSSEYLQASEQLVNGMHLVLSAPYDDIWQIRYDIAFKILMIVVAFGVFCSIIVTIVVRRVVKPLETLTDASQKLADGNYDVEIVHSNTYEIKLLSTAFENMIKSLREHEKHQKILTYRDSMTGLRNTTAYKEWIHDFFKEIQSKSVEFGVVVLDVNFLKETNDKYGHGVGNRLIVVISHIISDIFKRSPVFRIGGDEFVAILQNRDLENVKELFVQLDTECANTFIETEQGNVSVSIAKGYAKYDPEKDTQYMDVFNRADNAMYENKREMKGKWK